VITIEDWNEYVIVNAHFGLMVNRTLARVVGHVLSEESGSTVGIQQDPYRFIVQSSGQVNASDVAAVLRRLPQMDLRTLVFEASKKTGLFKRRMVHVARRFGAISRWTDFSRINLRQLMKSFEGTVILDEAFKEELEKDLDLTNTQFVLHGIESVEIRLHVEKASREPTPVARIGLERISRKSDLIPAEKMKTILVESTKARLLNEVRTFLCVSCLKYAEAIRVKELPKTPNCPECGSKSLGVLTEPVENIVKIVGKGKRLSEREERQLQEARDGAKLIAKYGKVAALALAGRRLTARDVSKILRKTKTLSGRFIELVMDAEKSALRRRFW
jgi:ATP-dependent Lhr-like helicase